VHIGCGFGKYSDVNDLLLQRQRTDKQCAHMCGAAASQCAQGVTSVPGVWFLPAWGKLQIVQPTSSLALLLLLLLLPSCPAL
jgi:hypothetical protein